MKRTATKKKTVSTSLLTGELLPRREFLEKYHIKKEDFAKAKLEWGDLKEIFKHYSTLKDKLEHSAAAIVAIFFTKDAKDQGVHSVRYRVKDPNSLVEKIIRKKIEQPGRKINLENYQQEINDLIGIRILHTFKNDWYSINGFIRERFKLKKSEKPIVYYREGDDNHFLDLCKKNGCKKLKHKKNYRSVHYTILTQLTKELHFAEIQVRTIFEEGWSEIDHKIRYSFKGHAATPFDSELSSLNGIAGEADNIASTIRKREEEEQGKILKIKSEKREK